MTCNGTSTFTKGLTKVNEEKLAARRQDREYDYTSDIETVDNNEDEEKAIKLKDGTSTCGGNDQEYAKKQT